MKQSFHDNFPGEYEILEKIGRGGTADVFLVRREGNSRPVVLKRFFESSANILVKHELDAARQFNFPGIVKLHRSGRTADGFYFLQMEYCDGPTLDELAGKITEKKLLSVLSAVSASLYVVHKAGFVHNDLKPSNIFCPAHFDDDSYPIHTLYYLKLADFSLAGSFVDNGMPNVTGTVGYMSPEMILKKEITASSDLFSLGVMAYYLACGRLPFESTSHDPLEVNALITEAPRPPLCGPAESFSSEIAELIGSLMEVDPARRPPSAFSLMEFLARLESPYPFRSAIRPRYLLTGSKTIDAAYLQHIFGKNSFSRKQFDFVAKTTAYHYPHLRLLLEHNFDEGNFARLDGRWGWKNDSPEVMTWSPHQIRFSLRPLRGQPISVKKFFLALAIVNDTDLAEKIAPRIITNAGKSLKVLHDLPTHDLTAMLYSLDRIMHPATRKTLSMRLAALFTDSDERDELTGRLLYHAERYAAAIPCLLRAYDKSRGLSEFDKSFAMLDLALKSAEAVSDPPQQASIMLKKALLEKERGMLPASESTYNGIIDLLDGTEHKAIIAQACKGLGDLYKERSDYQGGIRVLNRAMELYQELDDQLGLSHTYNNLGNMYWVVGKIDSALDYYQKALEIQRKIDSPKDIASSLNNIGGIHTIKGEYTQAISYYNESLEIKESLGDKGEIARTWNNLGTTYFLMGNAAKSIKAFERSLENNVEVGSKLEQLLNIENLSEAMFQAGRLTEALRYLKRGMALAEKLGDDPHRGIMARLTGHLFYRMGFYDESEKNLQKALNIAVRLDNKALLLPCYIDLAQLYYDLKELDEADRNVELAQDLAETIGDKNALFRILLIRLQNTRDAAYRTNAEKLLDNLNTPREKALLDLTILKLNIDREITAGPEAYNDSADQFFSAHPEDIDRTCFLLAVGRNHMLLGDSEAAQDCFEKALNAADKMCLLPEQWQATCSLSELTFKRGDFENSFQYSCRTQELLKKIAAKLNNSDRLGKLYNDKRIIDLLGRIKSLQKVLGKSKGAAVGSP